MRGPKAEKTFMNSAKVSAKILQKMKKNNKIIANSDKSMILDKKTGMFIQNENWQKKIKQMDKDKLSDRYELFDDIMEKRRQLYAEKGTIEERIQVEIERASQAKS